MGYMLPLRFIKVSTKPTVSICATRIVAMMSTDIYQARRTIHDEKIAGSLINACGKGAAKTAILLDNGTVVSSPLSIPVLINAIEKSNMKAVAKKTARLKVYDVYDEDPSPEIDELVSDISGFEDEDDENYEEDEDEDEDEDFIDYDE